MRSPATHTVCQEIRVVRKVKFLVLHQQFSSKSRCKVLTHDKVLTPRAQEGLVSSSSQQTPEIALERLSYPPSCHVRSSELLHEHSNRSVQAIILSQEPFLGIRNRDQILLEAPLSPPKPTAKYDSSNLEAALGAMFQDRRYMSPAFLLAFAQIFSITFLFFFLRSISNDGLKLSTFISITSTSIFLNHPFNCLTVVYVSLTPAMPHNRLVFPAISRERWETVCWVIGFALLPLMGAGQVSYTIYSIPSYLIIFAPIFVLAIYWLFVFIRIKSLPVSSL